MKTPNWDLLPLSPQEFFDLPPDFDRKDLKRAYRSWVLQFKPEKNPEAFQKIRAAFELLEAYLKSGRTPSNEIAIPNQFNGFDNPDTGRCQGQTPLYWALVSLDEAYADLKGRQDLCAADYLCLAILADATGAHISVFFDWLVQGTQNYPYHHSMKSMLLTFLKLPHPINQTLAYLETLEEKLSTEHFLVVSRPLWRCLIVNGANADWLDRFPRIEKRETKQEMRPLIEFILDVLPFTLFQADSKWVEKTLRNLKEHLPLDMPDYIDQKMLLLQLLLAYRQETGQRDNSEHPVRLSLERIFRAFCETEPHTFEKVFHHEMKFLAENPLLVMTAYDSYEHPDAELFLLEFLAQMVVQAPASSKQDLIGYKTQRVFFQWEAILAKSPKGHLLRIIPTVGLLSACFVSVILPILTVVRPLGIFWNGTMATLCWMAICFWIIRLKGRPWLYKKIYALAQRCYEELARSFTFSWILENKISGNELAKMEDFPHPFKTPVSDYFPHIVARDKGARILAVAATLGKLPI